PDALAVAGRPARRLQRVKCRSHRYSAFSTFTMCETARIMPRTATLSGTVTATPILCRPSPAMVRFCGSGRLMPLRISVTRSFLATVLPPHFFKGLVAQLGRDVGAAQLLKRIDGRVD